MRIIQLLEAEADDQAEREEAERVHAAIADFLTRHDDHLDEVLLPSRMRGGSWILPLRRVDGLSDYRDLLVAFAADQGNTGIGTLPDGRRIIVIAKTLTEPSSLRFLPTRFGAGAKNRFIHEFSHYLLDRRFGKGNSAQKHDAGDTTGYYNDPAELQAFYQEATYGMWRLAKSIASHEALRSKYAGMSVGEWITFFQKSFDKGFIDHLTDGNRRRIMKRLSRFVEQTIRPMFVDPATSR